jgi:hypothetical protein
MALLLLHERMIIMEVTMVVVRVTEGLHLKLAESMVV